MSTRNTENPTVVGAEMSALDALRRIHTEWTISVDNDGGFVAARSEPDDVIRATRVETLGQRLHAAQYPDRCQPKNTPTRADEVKKGHLVVMGPGHLRVVTAVEHNREGMVDLRLGTTWHSYEPDHQLDRAERRSQ